MRPTLCLAAALVLAGGAAASAQDRPELVVYAYDSFVSDWGPGPAIKAGFETTCGCTVRFVGAGDGAALLGRLRLEGARTDADVVVGLDSNLVAEARATGLFAPYGFAAPAFDLPVAWTDDTFLPFDWGHFAFVYDVTRLAEAPTSFEALAASDVSIVIQDPRSSTPGLGLLLWVKDAYGDRAAEIWEGLEDNVVTVTPGWSEAYGMFLEGEADMALSYTTSPAYHLIAEEDADKRAAIFTEGHALQVEVAARTAATDRPEIARDFLAYLVSDPAQAVIPTTNWMYPAVTPAAGLPAGFETLAQPAKTLPVDPEAARAERDAALAEWLAALGR